ncbi:MAG TPA: MoaD/ThiS family protein [Actinomycetales bacterium]|nr:MoaD/ThiS family protein [Actinomycetales bacterium]
MSVTVHVRYFAGAAAAAGVTEELLALDGPVTVASLREEIVARRPALAPVLAVASVLLDEAAVRDASAVVPDGASVDVLPPFAGG